MIAAVVAGLLASCAGAPVAPPPRKAPPPAQPARPTRPPPPSRPVAPVPATGFIKPKVLKMRGLEQVIGADAAALARLFGPAQLDVREGDARKLQFTGKACVLDVYLYPYVRNGTPRATYVDARRASDGRDVNRPSCVAALKR